MEKFQELRDSAGKKLQIADYMLTMTYPLVKDQKLLLSAVENLFLAYSYSISSLLHYERLFKRIPPFPDDFSSKIDLFADRCMGKYGIDSENLRIVKDLLQFDSLNPTKYDLTVASGYSLVAAEKHIAKAPQKVILHTLLPLYDNSGMRSVQIK